MPINQDVVIGAANLDVLAQIHDASGAALYSSDPIDSISASFDINLPAGTYYLSIDGIGWGTPMANPPVGYSDYGVLGYYSLIAVPEPGGVIGLISGVLLLAVLSRRRDSIPH